MMVVVVIMRIGKGRGVFTAYTYGGHGLTLNDDKAAGLRGGCSKRLHDSGQNYRDSRESERGTLKLTLSSRVCQLNRRN